MLLREADRLALSEEFIHSPFMMCFNRTHILSKRRMTGLLDRMERAGLIIRRADPHDRRAVQIGLTTEGRRAQNAVMGVVDKTLDRATKGLSNEEIDATKHALRRFLQNAQEERS